MKMPSLCACNENLENFTVRLVLPVSQGGYTQRHNELRGSFANLLSDVCHDVKIKPHLQPLKVETFTLKLTTSADDARLDIKAKDLLS